MPCTLVQPSELNTRLKGVKMQGIPLVSCKVAAGFPSPADDHLDNALSLDALMVNHPSATFFVRASGHSMQGIGIYSNDILVVDRSQTPVSGSVVIAAIDGECLVKIFSHEKKNSYLKSAHPDYPAIPLEQSMNIEIWGVVTGVIRQHGSNGRVCIG